MTQRFESLITGVLIGLTALWSVALPGCGTPGANGPEATSSLSGDEFAVLSVTPDTILANGGMEVTVTGRGFTEDTMIFFNDTPAASVRFVDSRTIVAVTPKLSEGQVQVTAEKQDGTKVIQPFTVTARLGVAPGSGDFKGGTTITIFRPTSRPVIQPTDKVMFATLKQGHDDPSSIGFSFDTNVISAVLAQSTEYLNSRLMTAVTPAHQAGLTYVFIVDTYGNYAYAGEFTFEIGVSEGSDRLRVVGAVAKTNTSVVVTFSEAVGPSAEVADNYKISGADGGYLAVTAADIDASDPRVVELTTLSQGGDLYTLHVVGVLDATGQPIAAPDGLLNTPNGPDPSRAMFAGIPPGSSAEQIDTDTDGLADWYEMQGWDVTVRFTNGTTSTFHVTSNPFVQDTDGDGYLDSAENAVSFDPRSSDTDADLISDPEEYDVWYTDPTDQDTDRDGLDDYLETSFFHTSPILDDTDGDQFSDDEEILSRSRNPRLADLPIPQIVVGEMSMQVEETFSYTDETGIEQTTSRSSSNTLTQGEESAFSETSSQATEATDTYNQELSVGYGDGSATGGFYAGLTVGAGQERSRGYTFETSSESRESLVEEYSESVEEALSFSERREVTRNVESASIEVDVTIINAGDLAFTISNLELSARVRDDTRRDTFLPLASLVPASGNDTFNLGPLDSLRGPFIFSNTEIFANRVLDLLSEPRAIVFDVANYDVTDEYGRNFVFSSEEVNDRTAGITIDYGKTGQVENYRVATASTFDADGQPVGITMGEALVDILGFEYVENEAVQYSETGLEDPDLQNSFATSMLGTNGTLLLSRIRGVQTNLSLTNDDKRFWTILSTETIPVNTAFTDIVLKPRARYLIWYVQDKDEDNLFDREEFLAGSSDENPDTDGDGILDFDEARVGWEVPISGNRYDAFPSPATADTDGDGLDDPNEQRLTTDPTLADTDVDGLSDKVEVDGYEVSLFDGNLDPTDNPVLVVEPYTDAAIIEPRSGGDGQVSTTAAGDDVQVRSLNATVSAGAIIILPGTNGLMETVPAGDDQRSNLGPAIIATMAGTAVTTTAAGSDDVQVTSNGVAVQAGDIIIRAGADGVLQTEPSASSSEVIRAAHYDLFGTDPLKSDTDGDSIPDGREQLLGSDPNVRDAGSVLDSDADGLTDAEEEAGWDIVVDGVSSHVTSDPESPDTDFDGLPDSLEFALRTDPRLKDTDADGLQDGREYDPADPADYFDDQALDIFETRCDEAINCEVITSDNPVGTSPLLSDTDGDTRLDGDEVNTPWDVCVSSSCREVYSDPLEDDVDDDQLNDAAELAAGTDPGLNDTDDDDRLDGAEVNNAAADGTTKSNPLAPDRLVSAYYTSLTLNEDWDPGDGQNAGEVSWTLQISYPGQSAVTLSSGSDNDVDQDQGYPIAVDNFSSTTRSFVVSQDNPTFTFSGTLVEADPAPNQDEEGSFSEVYGPPLNFGSFTDSIDITGDENHTATVHVAYTVYGN